MANKKTAQIVPSLLAADLGRLGQQLRQVRAAGVTWVSVDVMDGHFVPNLSFGPDFVKLAKSEGFDVDAHLMVSNPESVFPWFIDAGADIVTVHLESWTLETRRDAAKTLADIKRRGSKPGLAIKPKTSVESLYPFLEMIDLALIMTVEPGFGGQKFMPDMLPKFEAVRRERDSRSLDFWIQADGGVAAANIASVFAAGADSLVAGSSVFGAKDPAAAVAALREKIS